MVDIRQGLHLAYSTDGEVNNVENEVLAELAKMDCCRSRYAFSLSHVESARCSRGSSSGINIAMSSIGATLTTHRR